MIESHEVSIVRQVFEWYMEGPSASKIAKSLDDRDDWTRLGNNFTKRVIYNLFDQEFYYGRLILQTTFRARFGTRSISNDGHMTKYIVEHAHEAIMTPRVLTESQLREKAKS